MYTAINNPNSWKVRQATPSALTYIEGLFSRLQAMPEKVETYNIARTWWNDQNAAGHPNGAQADQMIKALKRHVYGGAIPQSAVSQSAPLDFKSIPDGNYAVRENGIIRFYRVSSTRTGYKKVQRRSSDNLLATSHRQGIAILHSIVEAGLVESQNLFSDKLERCWCCNKSLTDKVSRAYRMGPDCRSKRGF